MIETRCIDEIVVGPRFRRDFSGVDALASSIAAVGLLQPPGVTPDGRLLWGECRLRACRSLGWSEIPVIVREVDPSDFVAIEAAENFARKDFTPSEAVAIARAIEDEERRLAKERMATGGRGANLAPVEAGKARDKIAARTGMGRTTLSKARAIVEAAEAEPARFRHLVEDMDRTGNVDRAFLRLRQHSVGERVAKVGFDAERLGKFSVILADPPWDDEFGRSDRSIENHYPTMAFADILALPVASIAHDQAMLFLWATPSMLKMALQTAEAWGFEYRTHMMWVKPSIGLGKYVRQRHEVLLICRRGGHPAPDPPSLHDSVVEAPRTVHSAKPDIFHEIIERNYPGATHIELFARKQRPGWVTWGDEVPKAEAAE